MADVSPAPEIAKASNATVPLLGYIHSVHGSQASISLLPHGTGPSRAGATVGKFVKIHTGKASPSCRRSAPAKRSPSVLACRRGCQLHFRCGRALERRDHEGRRRRRLTRDKAGGGRTGFCARVSGAGAGGARSGDRRGDGCQPLQSAEEAARRAPGFALIVARGNAGGPAATLARQVIAAFQF
jgi:hypothetical protein